MEAGASEPLGPLPKSTSRIQYISGLTDYCGKWRINETIPYKYAAEVVSDLLRAISTYERFEPPVTDQGHELVNHPHDIFVKE